MNELKILITASTAAAKKAVKEVRDEIEKVDKSAKANGKSVTASMQAIAKGAAIAVGAIAAVTGAMAALGKSAQEVNKGFEKLNTTFKSAGSTSAQATDTYKQLFGILGDHDRTIETAQSLARVTTEADKLADYYNILAGSVAKYGDGLNSEVLAESISETVSLGKVTGELSRVLVEAGINEDSFNNSLAQSASLGEREVLVRNTLNNVLGKTGAMYMVANQATIQYNQSQANLNIALAQAARYTTPLLTSINNLGASLLTLLAPALQTVATYLTAFIQLMVSAIQWVGSFFGMFSSKTEKTKGDIAGYKKAMDNYLGSLSGGFETSGAGIDSNINKLKELKKQTMGFDELNVVSSPDASAASGGGGGGGAGASMGALPPMPNPADFGLDFDTDLEDLTKDIEEAKEKIKSILPIIASIAGAIALWKLADFISEISAAHKILSSMDDGTFYRKVFGEKAQDYLDGVNAKIKLFGGLVMIVAGALLLVQGYSDAWVNGLDWGNFATILAGIGLIVGGLALAFGPVAAGVGLVAGGIALLVLGIKDLIDNGFSMEAMLAVITGVILVCVGAVLAFNAALLANPITWVVIAIAALVAAIAICIIYWDDVKAAAIDAWDWIKETWEKVATWLDENVIQPIANFFKDLWADIKEIFDKVKEWFSEKFEQAWEGIKTAWSAVGSWFQGIWDKIGDIFGGVKEWFKDKFSAAWTAIKDVFANFGTYFSNLWDTIKTTFTNLGTKIGDAIGGAVKSGINKVITWIENTINKAIGLINGAIDLINKLPGVNVGKLSKLSLPRLAKGGVVDTATIAMIGEAGKEAVVPLENNTGWMDKLADRIASRNGNPSKIILKVGEKELGWATIGAINGITEQTGGLQLVL